MSESLASFPDDLSYRIAIAGTGLEFTVTNLTSPDLAKKMGKESGYHIELFPVTRQILDNKVERAGFIMAIMGHLEEQVLDQELVKGDGRDYTEIVEGIKLEIFSNIHEVNENKLSLIVKRVPEDFAREINRKKLVDFKKESLGEQILEQRKRLDPAKDRLN